MAGETENGWTRTEISIPGMPKSIQFTGTFNGVKAQKTITYDSDNKNVIKWIYREDDKDVAYFEDGVSYSYKESKLYPNLEAITTNNVVTSSSIKKDVTTPEKTPESSTNASGESKESVAWNPVNTSGTHDLNEKYEKGELSSSLSTIPKDYQNPDDSALSYSYENNKSRQVWVKMIATPVKKLSNNVRAQKAFDEEVADGKGQQTGLAIKLGNDMEYSFKFLVPEELIETITHSWEPYSSLASELQQLYTQYLVALPEQIKGMADAAGIGGKNTLERGENLAKTVMSTEWTKTTLTDVASKAFTALKGMTKTGFVANFRPDSPLQYKNSERRIFTLVFNLISINPSKNNETVVLPVKLLEMLSSPSYEEQPDEGTNTEIILPYVFSVNTTPGNLITCDMAVLKEVQPTWRGPWHNGYPARCELRLNFQEYRPLEQKVFYGTSEQVIKTVQRERATASANPEEKMNEKMTQKTSNLEKEAEKAGGWQ